ncbi:MAG: FtsX-like permease family protein [Tepidiformaceae bacterium]
MRTFGPIARMVLQRSLGHWRLLSTLITGIVLSAALMACVALYSDSIRDLGLRHALSSQPAHALDLEVNGSAPSLQPTDYAQRKSSIDQLLQSHASNVLTQIVHYGRSETFFLAPSGQPLPTNDSLLPRAHIQFLDQLAGHTHYTAGRAPAAVPPVGSGEVPKLELTLGKATADRMGVKVGDAFDLSLHWKKGVVYRAELVGLIEPNDLSEPYWFGRTDRFEMPATRWPTYPFFMDEKTFVDALGSTNPEIDVNYEVFGFVDPAKIDYTNARLVEDNVNALDREIRAQVGQTELKTKLATVLTDYRTKLFFTRLPLFALMLQIVGIVLFFVVMMSTMVIERQTGEIALLKSRGASTAQVMAIYVLEGCGLGVVATLSGPFIAAGAISLLGLTPPFHDLSGGKLLDVTLTPESFALAFFGALLSLAALLWPAYRACRYSITNYKQQLSRPPRQPVFLRYYLDLVLIGVGAFAFYELRQRGSLVTEKLFGDLSADPLLLVTPTLFMLMVALVFLRLFPLALRLGLWMSRRLDGPTLSMSLTRMARSPLQHSRLILLLILTTAVGMFAAGFRATLEQGYNDRAAQASGAPTRLVDIRSPSGLASSAFVQSISATTGATTVSPVLRLSGSVNISRFNSESVQLLGVKPDEFKTLGFWRDDYASASEDDLLARLGKAPSPAEGAPVVPPGAQSVGFWGRLPLPPRTPAPQVGLRFLDSAGTWFEYQLPYDTPVGNWQFFAANLANPSIPRLISGQPRRLPVGALTFDSLTVRFPGLAGDTNDQVTMSFDDLQWSPAAPVQGVGTTGFSDGTVIEDFSSLSRYENISGVSLNTQPGTLTGGDAEAPRTGPAAKITFIRGRAGASLVGLRRSVSKEPLPVLAASQGLERMGSKVGGEFTIFANGQYIPVKAVGDFDIFPGYDPSKRAGLFVADLDSLQVAATRVAGAAEGAYPNEAWMSGAPAGLTKLNLQEKGLRAEQVFDQAAIHAEQASDPLVAASWEGILFLSFGAVILISALAFIAYGSMSAQARSLEFAVLRTMGFSGRQILGVVTFEQAFVIVAGIVAGTLLGFPLSRLMIGYMGLTEKGLTPLPPLVSRVSWQAIVTVYASLAIAVTITVVSLVVLYSRLAVGRALRMGEL